MKTSQIIIASLLSISGLAHAGLTTESGSTVQTIATTDNQIKCTTRINGDVVQNGLIETIPQLGDSEGGEFAVIYRDERHEISVYTSPLEIVISELENGWIKEVYENSALDRMQQYVLSGGGKAAKIHKVLREKTLTVQCSTVER